MKKSNFRKRFVSFVAALTAAMTSIMMWSVAAGEPPVLQFRNEKVSGLTITKEIYRKTSDIVPLRNSIEDDREFYSENLLGDDEFRLFLLEGSDADSLAPKQGETYTRSNKYGNYYCCLNYSDSEVERADLIIKPLDSSGNYTVYYYDENNEYHDYSENVGMGSDSEEYSSADTEKKFKLDYGSSLSITKNFSTGKNGEFYLFDGSEGDQIYFRKIRSSYYYVTEDIDFLTAVNDKKINEKLTGVYDTDVPALSSGTAIRYIQSDANSFEVKNFFDKPNDVFTLKKTINYLDSDIFDNDEFTFRILINDDPPTGYSYTRYNGDEIEEEGVFQEDDTFVKLKNNQRIEIKGIMKNTPIEVREYISDSEGNILNPSYSPVTVMSSAEGKSYTLVEDNEEKYVSWEGVYLSNVVDTANFINVPNVMQIRKNITNPSEIDDIEEYEFEFEIRKYNDSSDSYEAIPENKQLKYYIYDGYGKAYGDESKNGQPFMTENGKLKIKYDQTAVVIGLNPGEKFSISETKAFMNGRNVTSDFIMDSNVYYKTARPETVNTAFNRSSSGEVAAFNNTYEQKLGINVSKTVEDKYGRADEKAIYTFKLQKKNGDVFEYVDNSDLSSKIKVTIDGVEQQPENIISFTLKDGQTANISNVKSGTYKVVEVDPTDDYDANPGYEENLFTTDVQVNGGNISSFINCDAVSEQFSLNSTESVNVDFKNKTNEVKYYFDIEKIVFLDRNIHGDDNDPEQRFIFKVDRFDEDLNSNELTDEKILETFYVDLSCDKEMIYHNMNDIEIDGERYRYDFNIENSNDYEFIYDTIERKTIINKTYGDNEIYQFPCSIWCGRKTVVVSRKGKYRISEVKSWSGTDYEFWQGSNRYKGYGHGWIPGDSVLISVRSVSADKFENAHVYIDNEKCYRPTASFVNSETEYANISSQSYAENIIK